MRLERGFKEFVGAGDLCLDETRSGEYHERVGVGLL